MKYEHNLNCNAPICASEEVCEMKSYTKFQKKQVVINKEMKSGHFRHTEEAFNAFDLENRSI